MSSFRQVFQSVLNVEGELTGGDCMNGDLVPCSMLLNSVGLPSSDMWLLDSGASVSVVSKDFLKGFQHSAIQTLVNPLQAANGTSVTVDGFCKVLLEIQVIDGKRGNKTPRREHQYFGGKCRTNEGKGG